MLPRLIDAEQLAHECSPALHIFLEQEPQDESERWSNRPFRSLSVVHPATNSVAPMQLASDKTRFLENLWMAQALYRARAGRSVPFVFGETELGGKSGSRSVARTYFNVYHRMAYLGEPKKVWG